MAWYQRLGLTLLGIIGFVIAAFVIQHETGVPFDTTYRIACAIVCLFFIVKVGSDFPGERWPRFGLWAAALFNTALFFTPLVYRSASRGEIMLFALPDTIIVLIAALATYRVTNDHQRAVRQQMILGLIVALAFCVIIFAVTLMQLPRR